MKRQRTLATALGFAAVAALAINLQAPDVGASDHIDGAVAADAAADIGDLYAWTTDGGNVVVALTFAGLLEAGDDPVYDNEVLYTINIDNTADPADIPGWDSNNNDNEADIQIHVRLGQNLNGEWFAQVTDLPGAEAEIVGPVEGQIGEDTARAHVGLFDDPFFFDFDGFGATAMALVDPDDAADIMFNSIVGDPAEPFDSFAGQNTMAIVLEFPAADARGDNGFMQIWGTTGRVPK
jgi:hypothetical protein